MDPMALEQKKDALPKDETFCDAIYDGALLLARLVRDFRGKSKTFKKVEL